MSSLITTKAFLEAVWPDTGPYCLASPFRNKDGKEVFAHQSFDDIDDVVQAAQGMTYRDKKHVFFCVHALVVGKKLNPTTGKYKTYRTHDNMRESRAFFFDLDVGETDPKHPKKYVDQAAAWAGLDQFLFRTGLPDPFVISSGGGLHVYWTFDNPLPSLEWRKHADKLRHIAAEVGLIVDPSRTVDQSSVLRVPGTINYKPHVQRPVEVLKVGLESTTVDLVAMLNRLSGPNYMPLAPLVRSYNNDTNMIDAFDGRLTPTDEVFETCEHMRDFRDAKGVVPEPFWYVATGTLMWAEDGEALVHSLSSGDPRYDFGETQTKLDQWRDKGPPTCNKINLDVGGDACSRCPFHGKGKNPLDIANKVWTETAKPAPVISLAGAIPRAHVTKVTPPFVRINGGVGVMRQDPTDPMVVKTVPILHYDLFPIEQFMGTEQEPGYSRWVVELPLEGQRVFTLPTASFTNIQIFMQALLDVGIFVPDGKDLTWVKRYMLHYLQDLQRHVQAQEMYDHLGWVYPDDKAGINDGEPTKFVMFEEAFDVKTGELSPCAMTGNTEFAREFIKKRGTLAEQIECMEFYNQPFYYDRQVLVLCSLATPFFRATGEHGVVVAAVGETGASKSTALYLAASLWGDHKKYVINGTPDGATAKARDDRAMLLANLPVCVDEITLFQPDDARAFVMSRSQPAGRDTMTQDRKHRKHRGGVKSTMTLVSSNKSLHELINTNNVAGQAGTVRVLEMPFEKEGMPHSKTQADRFLFRLSKNFGWIGPSLLTQLIPNLAKLDDRIRSEIERLNIEWTIQPEERFWMSAIGPMLTVGRLASKLGYHPYDMNDIETHCRDVLLPKLRARVRGEIVRNLPHEILANYLDAINGETLRIDLDNSGNLAGVLNVPHGAISARLDIQAREIWVRADRFGEYCTRHGHNRDKIATTLAASGLIRSVERRTLTKGIDGQERMRTICYIVDLTHRQATGIRK